MGTVAGTPSASTEGSARTGPESATSPHSGQNDSESEVRTLEPHAEQEVEEGSTAPGSRRDPTSSESNPFFPRETAGGVLGPNPVVD